MNILGNEGGFPHPKDWAPATYLAHSSTVLKVCKPFETRRRLVTGGFHVEASPIRDSWWCRFGALHLRV